MRKILYLLPLFLSILACGTQPLPPQDVSNIVNATLTAVAQNNPQVTAPQPTFTPISIQTQPVIVQAQPTARQQVTSGVGDSTLSLDILRNSTYHSPDWGEFQLSDGIYYRTPPTSQESPENYTTRLQEPVIYGDLNADGLEDALVLLSTQNGGTGHFTEMAAMLNLDGSALNVSTVYLGDRIGINSITITDGLITLNLVVQGPNDPLSGASELVTWNFHLDNGQLVQIP
jgi:hypothetical protein